MLTTSNPIKAGRESYYLLRAMEKYYTESAEERGQWFGKCGKALGLEGSVTTDCFVNLLRGFSPDGRQPLVQNAGHSDRCMGWDLTFNAPKSVSVLWALAPEQVRAEILRAHQAAVQHALTHLENALAVSRSGKAGAVHERAGLAVVVQQHFASRTNDPHLHSHSVIINVGMRPDGSTGALHSINWYRAKKTLGAVYQSHLAAGLERTLSLASASERSKDTIHVAGVPQEICDVWSKRRQAIKEVLKERGEGGAIAAQKATLATRPKKKNIPLDQLFANWKKEAEAHGWGTEKAERLIEVAREQKMKNAPAHEQSNAPAASRAADHPKEQGGTPAKAETRSQVADEPRAVTPGESTKTTHPQQEMAEGPKQSGQSEKPKLDSLKSAEASNSIGGTASGNDNSSTSQPPPGKQTNARSRSQQSATMDEEAKSHNAENQSNADETQRRPTGVSIEWRDAPDASGRKQKDPFRYLDEEMPGKMDRLDERDTRDTNLQNASIFTLLAPKSVSVLWALAPQAMRKSIEEAHQAAAEYALGIVESNMRIVRRDENGAIKEQGTVTPTSTEHRTIRRESPLLRTRTVLNIEGLRTNGAIDVVAGKGAVRVIYQVQLAAELQQRLGLTIEAGRKGFHVAGLPQDLCQRFSVRCEAVMRYTQMDANPIHNQRTTTRRPGWYRRLDPDNLAKVIQASTPEERRSAVWKTIGESFGWNATRTEELVGQHRTRRQTKRAFNDAFEGAKQRIFPEKQTGGLLSWLATKFAIEQGVGASELLRTLQKLRPAAERSWIHVEWRPLFPKAPSWSPLKNLKAPVIAIGNRSRRWDKILWRRNLILGELRLQQRLLFPRAPAWSPVHGLKLPALRFVPKKSMPPRIEQSSEARTWHKAQEHSQSH